MYSRRDIRRVTLAGLAGLAAPLVGAASTAAAAITGADTVGGIQLGVHTSSFRDLPHRPGRDSVDALIEAIADCGVRECELFAPQIEPIGFGAHEAGHHTAMSAMTPQMMRRELRKWRLRTPIAQFTAIGGRLQQAGIAVYGYNYSPDSTFSDEEIDRGFAMAKALGAQIITASMTLEQARRLAPFAGQHRTMVALSGQCRAQVPNQIASPAEFAEALALSPQFRLNVDIGQLTAANLDPVAFIRDHHAQITSVHLKDCRRNGGGAVAWGEGDTPVREVLQLLQRERWPIRAYVQYEYRGSGTSVEEVKRCFAYAKQVLA
jgi:sugar phosphate isomerase/epimerase